MARSLWLDNASLYEEMHDYLLQHWIYQNSRMIKDLYIKAILKHLVSTILGVQKDFFKT